MNSSWWRSLAGEDLSVKTDGQEKKEGAIKLRKPCWASPYGRMNYRRLAMLNVTMQHIIPDWSFLYWLDWIKYKCIDKVRLIWSRDTWWRGARTWVYWKLEFLSLYSLDIQLPSTRNRGFEIVETVKQLCFCFWSLITWHSPVPFTMKRPMSCAKESNFIFQLNQQYT